MKKFNTNSILFIFAMAFIVTGLCGKCFSSLKQGTIDMLVAVKHANLAGVIKAKDNIDDVSSKELSYHDMLMDIDSVGKNLLGTRVVKKDDTTIVKSDSGNLFVLVERLDDDEIDEVVSRIQALNDVSEKNGARFLYCAAPRKELYAQQLPSNVGSLFPENYYRLLAGLRASGIPAVDFSEVFKEDNVAETDIHYNTDHHWKTYSGFLASAAICRELSSRYGFAYNGQYTDLQNYTVTVYPNWFLGSRGKKVGRFFTWCGPDDFELITPNFETNMTEEQPYKKKIREGTFEETVLYMKNMEKNYYHTTPYSTYSGGDFRLQIMRNNLNPGGKRILLVRDSYACVVAPFLALQTSELHICDMRDYVYSTGDKLNLEEYISKFRPDYVIVLFSGVNSVKEARGKYDFF